MKNVRASDCGLVRRGNASTEDIETWNFLFAFLHRQFNKILGSKPFKNTRIVKSFTMLLYLQ